MGEVVSEESRFADSDGGRIRRNEKTSPRESSPDTRPTPKLPKLRPKDLFSAAESKLKEIGYSRELGGL